MQIHLNHVLITVEGLRDWTTFNGKLSRNKVFFVDIYIIFAVNSETESKRLIFCVETLCLPPWSSAAASEIFLQEEEVTTAPKASKQSDTPLKKRGRQKRNSPNQTSPPELTEGLHSSCWIVSRGDWASCLGLASSSPVSEFWRVVVPRLSSSLPGM